MKKKTKDLIQVVSFILFLALFGFAVFISMSNVRELVSEPIELKKDFCLYKNYSSYSDQHCYRIVNDDILIESPEVVGCNSGSGYCFKYVEIRE